MMFAISCFGQENKSSFLFREYLPSIVYLSNGKYTEERINFNLLDDQLYFIDKGDGQVRIINKLIAIDSIKIGARKFLLDNKNGVRELVCMNPVVYVKYKPRRRIKPSTAGFGGTSETSSVTSYSQLRSDGTQILKNPEFVVTEIDPIYWVVRGGEEKKFSDIESLIKIYPERKDKVEQYNKDKNVNMKNIADVTALCHYAQQP
jgi:hypothetical protein